MAAHTPGPWSADDGRLRSMSTEQLPEAIAVRGPTPKKWFVACAFDFNRYDRDAEVEANARLIAAAPELYDALREATARLGHDDACMAVSLTRIEACDCFYGDAQRLLGRLEA